MQTKTRVIGNERTDVKYGIWGEPPYFSITATIAEKNGNHRWIDAAGGCLHEHIRKVFPELAPLIQWHLCGTNGRPLHYVANAIYWAKLHLGLGTWAGKTGIPEGYGSFRDVLASHINTAALGDDAELNRRLRRIIEFGPEPDCNNFERWLESRMPALKKAFDNAMLSHWVSP